MLIPVLRSVSNNSFFLVFQAQIIEVVLRPCPFCSDRTTISCQYLSVFPLNRFRCNVTNAIAQCPVLRVFFSSRYDAKNSRRSIQEDAVPSSIPDVHTRSLVRSPFPVLLSSSFRQTELHSFVVFIIFTLPVHKFPHA